MKAATRAEKWYIIRPMPWAQRMAARLPEPTKEETEQERLERERRRGESILERECRNNGIEVYMPSFWTTVKHQRTNKLINKRFPFMVGYAFVSVSAVDFEKVRSMDSVMCFLKSSRYGDNVALEEEDIGQLMLAEMLRKNDWERERHEKEALGRRQRRSNLTRSLGLIMPKGRRKKIPVRMYAEAEIDKLPPLVKSRVLHILKGLEDLDKEDAACNEARLGVKSVA